LLLFIISIYFIFSKKKSLIAIPALLTLFIIIISVIPKYNVYTFSHDRQLTRLKNNLKKAKILQGNNIVPLKQYSDISRKLSKDIYSGIDHLCDFNSCKSIKELFPKIYSEIKNKKSDLKNKWTIIS
jgi:c-di-AMP phosphodiesterase-like protein